MEFTKWEHPSEITNAIIDIEKDSVVDFKKVFNELDILGCESLQIRYFSYTNYKQTELILELLNDKNISSIELILKYEKKLTEHRVKKLMSINGRLRNIFIYDSPWDKKVQVDEDDEWYIYFAKCKVLSEKDCGKIMPEYFTMNVRTYTESRSYNTCLNRKVAIDINGNIKNCPSCTVAYGNVMDSSLISAIRKKGFKDNWYIAKDQIDICKDCEFRHICTDCRAFLKDENNKYSKPLKCDYDPYTATWESPRASKL